MGAFSLTQKAKTDLKAIAAHTQRRWGKQQRMRYAKQFDDAFHTLADTPNVGSSCDYLKKGYRKFPNGSHVIFYRELGAKEIEIVRVLHKRMDVATQLRGT